MVEENVFVSINIPIEVGKKIYYDFYKNRIDRYLKGKYVPVENYHLTLKFFGNIGNKKIKEIKEKLRDIKFDKFELRAGRFGFFDNKAYGVFWIEFFSSELNKLVEEIWERVGSEDRKFKSHVTIFRANKILNRVGLKHEIKNKKVNDVRFIVEEFTLMKSELLPVGVKYKIINRFVSQNGDL